jgi:hypothetical protein
VRQCNNLTLSSNTVQEGVGVQQAEADTQAQQQALAHKQMYICLGVRWDRIRSIATRRGSTAQAHGQAQQQQQLAQQQQHTGMHSSICVEAGTAAALQQSIWLVTAALLLHGKAQPQQ